MLLASPFAQFGFNGLKFFNAFNTFIAIVFTYKIVRKLKIENDWLVLFILSFSPLYYVLTYSALTEPLFAAILALSIYLMIESKLKWALILISFLPFVRSEGLILIAVFVFYLFQIEEIKKTIYLLLGSVVYSIAGYFVYHDFLWVFTKIPYATIEHVYGSGSIFHFAQQLFYIIGAPICALFVVGLLSLLVNFFQKKIHPEIHYIILAGFISFFIAHTLFWYLGIFGSMGLQRVFIAVMPLIGIIALEGFNFIFHFIQVNRMAKNLIKTLIILYLVIFPFTNNPAAINWEKDMRLSEELKLAQKTSKFIIDKNLNNQRIIFNHHYFFSLLNIDKYEGHHYYGLCQENYQDLKPNDVIIWDNRYSETESKIKKTDLDTNRLLKQVYAEHRHQFGQESHFVVYQRLK